MIEFISSAFVKEGVSRYEPLLGYRECENERMLAQGVCVCYGLHLVPALKKNVAQHCYLSPRLRNKDTHQNPEYLPSCPFSSLDPPCLIAEMCEMSLRRI